MVVISFREAVLFAYENRAIFCSLQMTYAFEDQRYVIKKNC